MTHDAPVVERTNRRSGLVFALISATTFGLSGPLAKGLLDAGWTPAAAVTLRSLVAATALLVPALLALRGRWGLLRRNAGLLAFYGIVPVALTQLAYFNAVDHLQVSVALLIEYTAPVLVVGWLWLRYAQRPGRLTVAGAVLALGGLVLVLDVGSGAQLDTVGILYALGAMVGCAIYFIVNAQTDNGLPPLVLAAGGLLIGGLTLLTAGAVGLVAWHAADAPVALAGHDVAWWVPVLILGTVAAALSYVTGIEAARRLGSRLSSFFALFEVLAALVFSWLLLDQVPHSVQFVGGVLVLAGVVVVKLGEASRMDA